jgi:hypothetical protein
MIIMGTIWHFALAVPNIEQGMEEVGNAFDVTWRPVHRAETVLQDEHGVDHEVECLFTFSEGGPPSIEMWQSVPDTPLAPPGDTWLHHIGYWVNDLPKESERLEGHGFPCFMSAHSIAVHRGPGGLMLEPCDVNRDRPFLRDLFPEGTTHHGPPDNNDSKEYRIGRDYHKAAE